MEYGTCEYCGNEGPVGRQYLIMTSIVTVVVVKNTLRLFGIALNVNPKTQGLEKSN